MSNIPEQTTGAKTAKRALFWKIFWIALIVLAVLAVYKDIYKADFFLDDYLHLHLVSKIDNPVTPYITNLFMGAFFRPGVFIFWKINYLLFGMGAAGYYATNVLFLLALVLLVFYVVFNITGSRGYSAFATALFALNPVTNVGMIWLSNRFDLFGTTFYLLSLLMFLQYVRTKKRNLYIIALASGFFSYFCKEMMITLPVIMVIAASFMFKYRAELTKPRMREIITLATPFFTLGVIFLVWRFGVIHSLGGYTGEAKTDLTPMYLARLYISFSEYFWLMRAKVGFLVYLAIFFLLLAKSDFLKRNPLSLLGLSIAVITFIPLIMIFRMEAVMGYMTPRFFFLPNLGMTLFLASVFDPKSGKFRKFFATVFLGFTVILFSFNTFFSTYKWADDRHDNVKQMTKVNEFMSTSGDLIKPGEKVHVLLWSTDVALDAGMKMRYPKYMDKVYFLNPNGPTQVIGTRALHEQSGKDLNWPKTFDKNPCDYDDLVYGVVDTNPQDILNGIMEGESAVLLAKNEMGKLEAAYPEKIAENLAMWGVLQDE